MARQTQREAADLKKKLEDAERKAKDVATNLQVVIEGKFSTLPRAGSIGFERSHCGVYNLELLQVLARPRRPKRRSWPRSRTR
jgi:hypothetical protein